jgi:DNA-binding NarL/FixJ family response regulator
LNKFTTANKSLRLEEQLIGAMQAQRTALIIAKPGSLSNSLKKLLESTFQVKPVCQVEDYRTALEIVKQHHLELVVLDFNLPYHESLTSLTQLKKTYPKVPCLALVDSEGERRTAESAGADIALIKGTPASTFLTTIEELLSHR